MLRHSLLAAAIVGGLAVAGFAQEVARSAEPPQHALRDYQRTMAFRPPMEKRAWIGVGVSPATPAVAHQLKLAEGTGLIVEYVEPKSPADEAEIKPYDLLVKLDDQLLVNPEQFAVLVRMHKPGDSVKLTLLREGEHKTVSAKLIEHETPRLSDLDGLQLWMAPGPQHGAPPMAQTLIRPYNPQGEVQKTVTWFDGKRQITVTRENGKSTLVETDVPTGRILLKAPVDTEEERNALPEDIRDVVKHLPVDIAPGSDAHSKPQKDDQ